MMATGFVFTYPGSGRPTGQICDAHHNYHQGISCSAWAGPHCNHTEYDGYPSGQPDAEIDHDFLVAEHGQIGHVDPVVGCPSCEATR